LADGGRLLFSGDQIMQGSTVVIAPPDGDMAIYLASLARLQSEGLDRIAPGHGDVIEDPSTTLDAYLTHRLAREAAILAALGEAGRAGVDQLVQVVYTEVPEALHPVARYSVWAHLRKLQDDGRASTGDRDDIDAPWEAVAPSGRPAGVLPR
jgi:glyoxylase-like metal-dependent hydrolase (beta-lactamase superfamily II)